LVKVRLQNQRGGYLVDDPPVILAEVSSLVEDPVGFAGRQPFIPEVDRQSGQLAKFRSKRLIYQGLWARFAGQVHRITDHDAGNGKPPRQSRQRAQVVPGDAAAGAPPLKRKHRLRRQAQPVRDGHSYAPIADVQAKEANYGGFGHVVRSYGSRVSPASRWF
jgi:hypothetical protein